MSICLNKKIFKEIKDAEIWKEENSIKREKLLNDFFKDKKMSDTFTTKDVAELNNRFEKTKLLKSTETGYDNMVKKLSMSEEDKATLIENKKIETARKLDLIKKLQNSGEIKSSEILNIEKMSNDIYSKKYKLEITPEQTKQVINLTNEIKLARELPKLSDGNFDPKYGIAKSNLGHLIDSIKNPTDTLNFKEHLKYNKNKSISEIKDSKGFFGKTGIILSKAAKIFSSPVLKTLKASLDASYTGVQGIPILMRNPEAFGKSFVKALDAFRGKDALEQLRVLFFSDKDYEKAILGETRLLSPEEQLAGAGIIEKIPWLGKAYKRADDAFTVFLQNSRFQEFKRVLNLTERKLGRELDPNIEADLETLKEIGSHANKVTGTTNLGSFEKHAGLLNEALFAARYAVSDVRNLTDMFNPFIKLSTEARLRSAGTLGLNVGALYGAYTLYSVLNGNTKNLNPASAHFMQVKVGDNVWLPFLNIKGKWLYQLLAKLAENKEINSRGKTIKFGTGYNAPTRGSVFLRTLRGKSAPVPSVLTNILTGRDFTGKKTTISSTAKNLVFPISAGSVIDRLFENKDSLSEQFLLGVTDMLGFSGYKVNRK